MLNIENIDDKKIIMAYIIVVLLSTWTYIFLIFQNTTVALSMFIWIMFFPAIVAIIFSILQGKSIKSMFGCVVARPSLKPMLFGIGYPIIFVGICAIIAIITSLGYFNPGTSTISYT
jgi:uncharacterized integral membrane protein